MKVRINREECIGCAVCEALCPEVFKLMDDSFSGIVEKHREGDVSQGTVSDDLKTCVESARDSCPVSVITTE